VPLRLAWRIQARSHRWAVATDEGSQRGDQLEESTNAPAFRLTRGVSGLPLTGFSYAAQHEQDQQDGQAFRRMHGSRLLESSGLKVIGVGNSRCIPLTLSLFFPIRFASLGRAGAA